MSASGSAEKHGFERHVVLGVGGAPHGVRGELRVKTFTEDPLAIGSYGPLTGSDGRTYDVVSVRPARNVVVARLKGVDSREAAEALNGVEFSVPRAALGDVAEAEVYFQTDLIGLRVVDENGTHYGQVIAVHDFGGGDMLEIEVSHRRTVTVPFSKAAVPVIDIAAGTLTIEPVAAGLVEDEEAEDAP